MYLKLHLVRNKTYFDWTMNNWYWYQVYNCNLTTIKTDIYCAALNCMVYRLGTLYLPYWLSRLGSGSSENLLGCLYPGQVDWVAHCLSANLVGCQFHAPLVPLVNFLEQENQENLKRIDNKSKCFVLYRIKQN